MRRDLKEFEKEKRPGQLPESYLLCPECDGTWVDSRQGDCHCGEHTTSRDFVMCLSCALAEHKCQHCGQQVHVHITKC